MSVPLEVATARPRAHINSLPVEVLSMIFLSITLPLWFVGAPDRPIWKQEDLPVCTTETRYIARVCRRWNAIAMTTPALWAWLDVQSCRQLSLLPTTIARSGNTRLFLRLWTPTPEDTHSHKPRMLHPMQRSQWSPGLDALVQNMHRIAYINLSVVNWEDARLLLDRFREAEAPLLRYFLCFIAYTRTVRIPRDIFRGVAPSLQHVLLLEVFPEDWGSPVFASVKYFDISSAFLGSVSNALRARQSDSHLPPTISDLSSLLDAAPELRTLDVMLFALVPSVAPVVPRHRHYPKLEYLSLRLPDDPEAFRQLASIADLSLMSFLDIAPLSQECASELFSHLHDQVDLAIKSQPPKDDSHYLSAEPFYDDSYDVGWWHIRSHDSADKGRILQLGQHDFRRDRILEVACAPIFPILTRLKVVAGQWPQVSDALSRVSLPAVSQLVIQYSVERCMLGDSHGTFRYPFEWALSPPAPMEPLRLYPLRGTRLALPALQEVVILGEHGGLLLGRLLPLRATMTAIRSLAEHLSLNNAHGIRPRFRLVDVVPDDDDACAALESISEVYTLEKNPSETGARWHMAASGYWWHKRFGEK